MDVLNYLHMNVVGVGVGAKRETILVPRPDLSALFEAALVSFMVIEKTHVQTIRYDAEKTSKSEIIWM